MKKNNKSAILKKVVHDYGGEGFKPSKMFPNDKRATFGTLRRHAKKNVANPYPKFFVAVKRIIEDAKLTRLINNYHTDNPDVKPAKSKIKGVTYY